MTDEATSTPERRTQRLEKRVSRERTARLEAESIAERATRELSRINLEYQKLFDLSLNLLCTLDTSLNFRELNPAWENLLGWTHEELRSRPALEFVHPDDLAGAQAEAQRMLESEGSTVGFDHRFRHKDGRWIHLSWSATLSGGTFYAVATDVTERSRVREQLAESEARTRAILDNTVDAIVTIDETGQVMQANPATETLFGYSSTEFIGRNVSLLMPTPYKQAHDGYLRSYLETGNAKIIGIGREVIGRRKDGTTFPLELSIGEVRLEDRRMFTGILRDVSQRKAAETRLGDTMTDLKKSRDDMLATLDQLRAKTMLIDEDERITFLSQGGISSVGWPAATGAIGKRWDEFLPVDNITRNNFRAMLRSPDSTRTRVRFNWMGEQGHRRWVEAEIKDDPRNLSNRVVFFYDVSELHELRARLSDVTQGSMVGTSQAMRSVYERISEVALGDWTALIEGETGVGKELVARAIHAASSRREGPFIAVNCAGLTDSLLESQLFGHRRGSFTGAVADQQGFFEAAMGGTILLDEIGDVSVRLQASLLRVIQEREITRVGDAQARMVDVRILAATNRDLGNEVASGRFREDLFYRIRVARVSVPPLRERLEDVPLLAASFLAEQRLSSGKPILEIEEAAKQAMQTYRWPGNVRELKAAMQFAVIAAKGSQILLEDLPPELTLQAMVPSTGRPVESARLPPEAEAIEGSEIFAALEWAEGNRARAARKLGMSRATFYRRLEALGIPTKKKSATTEGR